MKTYRKNSKYPSPDTFFILLLLCVFAFSSLMLVIFGANAYTQISERKDMHFQRVTPLSYIAAKVRQSDGVSALRTENSAGADALVISSNDGGQPCETWIYEYEGSLCELYIDADTPFDPAAGTAILESHGTSFALEDGALILSSGDEDGLPSRLTITPRGSRPTSKDLSGGELIE